MVQVITIHLSHRKDFIGNMLARQQQRLKQAEYQLCLRAASLIEEQRGQREHPLSAQERPRIGIFASRGIIREGAWPSYAGDLHTVEAIAQAGGSPLLLPCFPIIPGLDIFDLLANENLFRSVFESIWPVVRDVHGLVFTGGGDLDSRFFYHMTPHPHLQNPDLWRDIWEWFSVLINWALFKTTFGICRGVQLMNVALGGELFQDRAELQKRKDILPLLQHRRGRPIFKNLTEHPLYVVPGSYLAQAIRSRGEHAGQHYYLDAVYSQHHNFVGLVSPETLTVVGKLAEELAVIGYAPDGVIEAICARDPRRKFWGVQFHPEYMRSLAWSSSLFSFIIEQCRIDTSLSPSVFDSLKEDVFAWLWLRASTLHGRPVPGHEDGKTDELTRFTTLPLVGKVPTTESLQDHQETVFSLITE